LNLIHNFIQQRKIFFTINFHFHIKMSLSRKPNLKEPLVSSNRMDLEEFSERITESIEGLSAYIQAMEEFDTRLGSKEDTRAMRENMKEEISEANDELKKTMDLFKQFDSITLKRKEDMEYRNKMLKRAKDNFNKQNDKFTQVLKSIQRKEKIYLQAKQAGANANSRTNISAYHPIGDEDFVATQLEADLHDLNFTEQMIKERQEDVIEIRKLAHELNLTSQYQAQKLHEASLDIELIEENTRGTESEVQSANKHLDEALRYETRGSRRNHILCCLIILGLVIVSITASNLFS